MKFLKKLLTGAVVASSLTAAGVVAGALPASAASSPSNMDCRTVTGGTGVFYTGIEWRPGEAYAFAPGRYCSYSADGQNEIIFQGDGNLVVYHDGAAVWQTGTYNVGATSFDLQNDGNMVIYRGTTALWQSETYGTNAPWYELLISNGAAVASHTWLSSYGVWITDWQV